MSINLLEAIQKNLRYPPLQKIDPNTQQTDQVKPGERFSQAAIPAILIAFYEYSRNDDAAKKILSAEDANWIGNLFADNKKQAVERIAAYAKTSPEETLNKMNEIANETVLEIRKAVPADATILLVKDFLAGQRNSILPYLPAGIKMGILLNDATLDDNTNKMDGPISSLMHAIGGQFSTPDIEKGRELPE